MEKRNFLPIDELRYKKILSARLSPDGVKAVYSLRQHDIEKESSSAHLWLIDLESRQTRQLTYSGSLNVSPEWSPDGKTIAFRSDRSGKPQIYLLPVDGGEAVQFTCLEQGVGGGPVWSPDGAFIAFTAGPEGGESDPSKPFRVTRAVYRFDNIGYLDQAVQNVCIQALHTREAKKLTDHRFMAQELRWSPDGSRILYMAGQDPERFDLFSASIHSVDREKRDTEILGLDWGWISAAEWTKDGQGIIFSGTPQGKAMGSKADLWLLKLAGGEKRCLSGSIKNGYVYGFGKFLIDDSDSLLGNIPAHGMEEIWRIAINGKAARALATGERSAHLQDKRGSRVLFIQDTPFNPAELGVIDLDTGTEQIVTHINTAWLEEINLPRLETLHFPNPDGLEIEGWLLLPNEGQPPYPTVLYNHGGPHGCYGYSFRADFQMLAGAGYAVLFINPHGSVGYGEAFSAGLSGNWGLKDYPDLMAGLDYAIQKGWADANRLGVCGLSYGGYLTTFIVGQTSRFKAAVAENPITDLVSRYGTADMGAWGSLGEIGGKPHEIPEVYRRSSPITYAHQCGTPTLLVQGESDYRCPAGQSEQFYTTLRASGCIAEMLRLPNMPHGGSSSGPVAVQKAQNEALLGWMNRYVLGMEAEKKENA
jgi:dipeptidyl aminopeptidase/acylaminoacyl peptidase